MPIEIRITDAENLRPSDINALAKFLFLLRPTESEGTIKQEIDTDANFKSEIGAEDLNALSAKKAKCDAYEWAKSHIKEAELEGWEGSKGDIVFDTPTPKPRKKRKTKKEVEESLELGDFLNTPSISNYPDLETKAEPSNDITYEELIAYVLENTRTKKLLFSTVTQLVSGFHLNSIDELKELPGSLSYFYALLKDRENNE